MGNGSSECSLLHSTSYNDSCGSWSAFTAKSGTGFGTNATSFTSTLSGTATLALDGTLVECSGPDLDRVAVGSSELQILGWYYLSLYDVFEIQPAHISSNPAHLLTMPWL